MKNIMFLDFDGVVNTPIWDQNGMRCRYNHPLDSENPCVNNFQAVQWISEFCEKYNYDIVITSTWRKKKEDICDRALYNGGLRDSIGVIGCTPIGANRDLEIREVLRGLNSQIANFIIIDDEGNSFKEDLASHLIKTDPRVGFTMREFQLAANAHNNGRLAYDLEDDALNEN